VKRAIALAILAACDHHASIESCRQDLGGTYVFEGQRWMMLDDGVALEAYPLFPDVPGASDLEVAPRVLDLVRDDDGIAGHVHRRYMRGAAACEAAIPARITVCADDALDVLLADPVPPLQFGGPFSVALEPSSAPGTLSIQLFVISFTRPICVFPRPGGNRRERWHRE
jgi:hypothetical protein